MENICTQIKYVWHGYALRLVCDTVALRQTGGAIELWKHDGKLV